MDDPRFPCAPQFTCVGAQADPYAAVPTLVLRLRITDDTPGGVHAITLRCQIRIEPARRQYTTGEAELLGDLFGPVARWRDTVRAMQLATLSVTVPPFTGSTDVDVPVPCGYDLEVAAGKYFASLEDGEIPLLLLFSGTVFCRTERGFEVTPVPWDREARYRLPVALWHEVMDLYFPGTGWLRLRRDTLRGLLRYKSARALATWDETVERLLEEAGDR
ncbi:DUF6084 family protein [Actinoallomurus liliacearum]|uniref:DUF6084 family protein n=1 Tax=Actinoallomurus liliacearum TaxID=1080073 RepID=A0ABP8TCT0_9ACTN